MTELLYLLAAVLFILGLKRLGHPRSARSGNLLAATGMLLAVLVTLVDLQVVSWLVVIAGLAAGTGIGAMLAVRVQMTSMPELVAAFNGFGGAASALVALAETLRAGPETIPAETGVTAVLSVAVGAVTLSGSFIAFGKLQGILPGRPIGFGGTNALNAGLVGVAAVVATWAVIGGSMTPYWLLAAVALLVGILGVLPIGGADMPVVISLLNSCSGLAAAAAGFVISNSALIIGGALVGAAGLILTFQMSEGMNRSLANVLFSKFGVGEGGGQAGDAAAVQRASVDDVAITLGYANSVIVVPGYGMAVAQAQHALHDVADALEARGVEVNYAIHPVAGRMPGHMNVLLAEADVPYEQLLDLDQSNPKFAQTDVVVVVGANDVVNPSARTDTSSPIYGMPILDVDRAKTVVVIKRSLSPGFAGIDNPLFYLDNTLMLFADAKEALEGLARSVVEV